MFTVELKGIDEALRNLDKIKASMFTGPQKAAMRASARELRKALNAAISASGASRAAKRKARATVRHRVLRARGLRGNWAGKAGFGVGKSPIKPATTRGVGISYRNIHWLVLGTQDRYTKKGKYTGRVPPLFKGLMSQAYNSARERMLEAARLSLEKSLEGQLRRLQKKIGG